MTTVNWETNQVFVFCFLQVDFFTFNPSVRLDPPIAAGSRRPELDLSRGVEPTPVELCPRDVGACPPDFRYRKDRWPHGCFLSSGPTLFSACCDCTDGCTDAQSCTCIAMTRGGQHYTYNRLTEPVPSGYDKITTNIKANTLMFLVSSLSVYLWIIVLLKRIMERKEDYAV